MDAANMRNESLMFSAFLIWRPGLNRVLTARAVPGPCAHVQADGTAPLCLSNVADCGLQFSLLP